MSGLPWTFVRPGAFMTDDLMWVPQIINGRIVRGLYGGRRTGPGRLGRAVRALLDERVGEACVLTGP